MITLGFSAGYSDIVTIDQDFSLPSLYILISGTGGDLVWENTLGQPQYISNAGLGLYPVAAKKILSSATVNGTPRTTTADGITYFSSNMA